MALLDQEPDRVSGWFTFVWGNKSAKTFNIRLTALTSACVYWRKQEWLAGDPLARLRAKPAPPDTSKALSRDRVADILGSDTSLRDRVLWHMLYESSARAEEVLMKLSGHTSVRSLAKYARVSDEGLVKYQAETDPAARRRGGR